VSRALRFLLTGLVLCNLAFVQMTESASWVWLGPLVALTLASPFLVRLRGYRLYRLLWNLAVVGVFAQLVHHTTSAGAEYLLEDGLLLAALCQVHLLNNIGPDQKPDLLLFNSYLVVVVTSFLSMDLGFSLVFVLYALFLILSLQVLTASRLTVPGPLRPVLRDAFPRALVVLACTMVVFFLWPRDFHRRGLLTANFEFRPGESLLTTGFTDEVSLDRSGGAQTSQRVALRVELLRGRAGEVPAHWRGAVLDRFDGSRWYSETGFAAAPGRLERIAAVVRVEVPGGERDRRFAPLDARTEGLPERGILQIGPAVPARTTVDPRYLSLPRTGRLLAAMRLADRLAGDLPQSVSRRVVAARLCDYLKRNREYLPPTENGGARSLAQFIEGEQGGHCETFATALAVMLRHRKIPCRLATGYLATEWDPEGRRLLARERDAHAWVEVLDPERGWYVVDPTPAGAGSGRSDGAGLFGGVFAFVSRIWGQITGFDAADRRRALERLLDLPATVLAIVRDHPGQLLLALAAITSLLLLRRRLKRRFPPEVRAYLGTLHRTGLSILPGETPRDTLARARERPLPPKQLGMLERAVREHEQRRYTAGGGR
jgi:transglutaminase-like putative cysteine protease